MTRSTSAIISIDFGSVNTRASYFDVIDGEYRYVAGRDAPTTIHSPNGTAMTGLQQALFHLQEVTGRQYFDSDWNILVSQGDPLVGIQTMVATASAGKPLRVLLVGLTDGVSTEVAQRALGTSYFEIVESIHLTDLRPDKIRVEAIRLARPDIVFISGGIEGGATRDVLRLSQIVVDAINDEGRFQPPQVIYAGNSELHTEIQALFSDHSTLTIIDNIRPELAQARLAPALDQLADVESQARTLQGEGYKRIADLTDGNFTPTAAALGTVIQFASRIFDAKSGVMGVDVGARTTTIASALDGDLQLTVRPDLGIGQSIVELLNNVGTHNVLRWLPFLLTADDLSNFVHNKALNPSLLPEDRNALLIEQALAREAMRVAREATGMPSQTQFEPIIGSGAVLSGAPHPGMAALMMLDALQPVGVTTLLLDQNSILPALGAMAQVNPIAAVQVFGSGSIVNLGSVISPVGKAKPGQIVLQVEVAYANGDNYSIEVPFGELELIAIPQGEEATVTLQPLRKFDIGFGEGQGRSISNVSGGLLGLIIDARGRPFAPSPSPATRLTQVQNWLNALGGT